MRTRTRIVWALGAAACLMASSSSAEAGFTATFTADNHYAIYGRYGGEIVYFGGNETGASGSLGGYNWSNPETWSVALTPDTFYIAAWSDDATAQGLIGHIEVAGRTVRTGDEAWRVYTTGVDLDTGDPHPLASDIAWHVGEADATSAWETPYIGAANGSAPGPWNQVTGIDAADRWTWVQSPTRDIDTLTVGGDFGEYLIFRMEVPPPSTTALFCVAGMIALRRRA